MANNIFDWDEEEEKVNEAEVWSADPAGQPPEMPAAPPVQPPNDTWDELETVMRPRPELPPYEPQPGSAWDEPLQDPWKEEPRDAAQQAGAQPGVWSEYTPETPEETARRGGLAWSAGIAFFSSVVFMLFIGWIVDWLLASSPWGLIGGIVVGSLLGFLQFVRITSRIFRPKQPDAVERPLMPLDRQ